MTYAGEHFMAHDGRTLQGRFREFVNREYPSDKHLAQAAKCDPRTARNMRLGHWPAPRHLAELIRRHGRLLISVVFDPELDDVAARIELAIREREGELEELKAQLRAVAPVLPDQARLGKTPEDRSK
jgi:hypothetical protein